MKTVQNNCNITKGFIQDFLKINQEKLCLSNQTLNQLIKGVKRRTMTKEKLNIFYQECLKRLNGIDISGKGKHFTSSERIVIEVFFTAGFSKNFIATFVGKNRSTVGRELNKNKEVKEDLNCTMSYKKASAFKSIEIYSATKAQLSYISNRSRSKKKYILEKNQKLRQIVIKLLKGDKDSTTGVRIRLSPKSISGCLKNGNIKGTKDYISASAIYNASNSRKFGFTCNDLPHGRKYYKKLEKHAKNKEHSERKKSFSIENMPQKIKDKESLTHFEGDSIIGKREGSNNTLITLVNTSSKFVFIKRSKNKTAGAFVDVLDKLENEIPELNLILETLLLDNGCEFSDIDGIMKSCKDNDSKRLSVYYAHPYSSYERGCNENKNREVRKDFPKGRQVEEISDLEILNIGKRINNTPREILGWKTALQVFEEQLKERGIDTKFLDKYRIKRNKIFSGIEYA